MPLTAQRTVPDIVVSTITTSSLLTLADTRGRPFLQSLAVWFYCLRIFSTRGSILSKRMPDSSLLSLPLTSIVLSLANSVHVVHRDVVDVHRVTDTVHWFHREEVPVLWVMKEMHAYRIPPRPKVKFACAGNRLRLSTLGSTCI